MQRGEKRKIVERDFQDSREAARQLRREARDKFYSITRSSQAHLQRKLLEVCPNATALDYGCGNANWSVFMAKAGAQVVGIDISILSLQKARQAAVLAGVGHKASFMVIDAESLAFPDNSFDLIFVGGMLHHVDVERAFPELSRVLKPGGRIFAVQGLGPCRRVARKLGLADRLPQFYFTFVLLSCILIVLNWYMRKGLSIPTRPRH